MQPDLSQLQNDVARLKSQMQYLNEIGERLDGRRGTNRAIKQSDLTAFATYKMKSPATSSGTLATDYANLRADIQELFIMVANISNLYGTAPRPK